MSGAALIEHLKQAEQASGKTPDELDEWRSKTLPVLTEDVFEWFSDLSSRRTYTEKSANAISFTEIDAWCRLTNTTLCRMELEYILAFDNLWLGEYHKQLQRMYQK